MVWLPKPACAEFLRSERASAIEPSPFADVVPVAISEALVRMPGSRSKSLAPVCGEESLKKFRPVAPFEIPPSCMVLTRLRN